MPDPRVIKVANTGMLVELIEGLCAQAGLKPSTRAGAGFSVYVNAILEQAQNEGIDKARRNLDRAIVLLQAMREAPHAEGMEARAHEIVVGQTAEIHERDGR